MSEKKKIFAFNNGGSPGFYGGVAVGEDGACLAQHLSSSEGFLRHDLGVTSDWKHENYDKHFGAGNWEIEWVPTDQVMTHPGLLKAIELNKVQPEAA